jgi:hypothetical protein
MPAAVLKHRYSFNETSGDVEDSVGTADAKLIAATFTGDGKSGPGFGVTQATDFVAQRNHFGADQRIVRGVGRSMVKMERGNASRFRTTPVAGRAGNRNDLHFPDCASRR